MPRSQLSWVLFAASLLLSSSASAVTIDWVTVGGAGNAADTTGFGDVSETYRISKFEVTNAQYAEFLNAVAADDSNGLYDTRMGSAALPNFGGINRSENAGSFTYSVVAGRGSMPVNWVDFYDSLRFANWLHNGQPTGGQDDTTTEHGAYTITAQGIADNSITRNAAATIFLPSENEWYKAAYYDTGSASYFDFPAGSNMQTTCALPGTVSNTANCGSAVGDFTAVGSYTGSASPSGTFDQGGNAWEWNEETSTGGGGSVQERGLRGGSFNIRLPLSGLEASDRSGFTEATREENVVGFRIASVPEPSTGLLVTSWLLLFARCMVRRG